MPFYFSSFRDLAMKRRERGKRTEKCNMWHAHFGQVLDPKFLLRNGIGVGRNAVVKSAINFGRGKKKFRAK